MSKKRGLYTIILNKDIKKKKDYPFIGVYVSKKHAKKKTQYDEAEKELMSKEEVKVDIKSKESHTIKPNKEGSKEMKAGIYKWEYKNKK